MLAQQLAIAKQPSYLEQKERFHKSEESILRQKMKQVRKEINKLNEKLKANIEHLHELEKELSGIHIEKRRREIEESINDAKAKIEDLKKSHAPEEKIEGLVRQVRQVEEWKRELEKLHRPEHELFGEQIEQRIRELKEAINDAKAKIEDMKRKHAPEEEIYQLIKQVEKWKRDLEKLHRPERELFDEHVPPPERHARVMVIHLEHAPAEYIAEIVEDFLTPEDGIVRADERTNSLIIRDIEPSLHDTEMIIRELDRPERPYEYIETEFMIPEHGREIANVLDITEEFIVVNFPEHSEWPEIELWIPFREQDDGEWVKDEEITEQVRQLEMGAPIEVEWEKYGDDDRFWIVWFEPQSLEIPFEEIQELMEHALDARSPEEAVERFENVLEHDPECKTIYGKGAQIMVGVNLMKLGKLEEAEDSIKAGLNLFPEDDRSLWTLAGYEALGDIYRERDDLDKAIDTYQHAMNLYNPDDLREPIIARHKTVRMKLAQIYIQTDQKELALDTLESAIALEVEIPKLDAHAHLMLGELQMKSGDLESAKAEFQKVLDLAERPEAEVNEDDIEQAKANLEKIEESE